MAEEHPELVTTFLKGMIKVGRWANANKRAAAEILNKQTFYLDVEQTYQGIKHVDMVPSLSAQNMASIEIGKDFMFSHGYIKRDFDVHEWARPTSSRRPRSRCSRRSGRGGAGASCPRAARSRPTPSGSGSASPGAQPIVASDRGRSLTGPGRAVPSGSGSLRLRIHTS